MIVLAVMAPLSVLAAEGDVWIEPANGYAGTDQPVALTVYADTGAQRLGAYQLTVTYDPAAMGVSSQEADKVVKPGADGFVTAANVDAKGGRIVVNGVDVYGKGPGIRMELMKISLKSLKQAGPTEITLDIEALTDEHGKTIGKPAAANSVINIR